jgi:hypothetical protein
MIARFVRFTRQPAGALTALEDALGVAALFLILYLGLSFSGSV